MVIFLLSEELLFHRSKQWLFLLKGAKQLYMQKIIRASHNHYNLLKHTQSYKNKRKYYIKYKLNQRKII